MAVYSPSSLGIKAPAGGFQQGGFYNSRQYWNGTLSDAGYIHPESNQQGAGEVVGSEVRAASAAQQGVSATKLNTYIANENARKNNVGMAAGSNGLNGGLATGQDMSGGGTSGAGIGAAGSLNTGAINLQSIYDTAYADAGITKLQDSLTAKQAEIDVKRQRLAEASATINENPFFAEGTRSGRIAKLEEAANKDINNLTVEQNNIANQIQAAKTDVDTKLGIATKQFDINSQASTQALNQFNTLLQAGALNGANAADLAAFSAQTGIATSFLNSAVNLSKKKNIESKLIQSTDDSGNVTVSLVQISDGQMSVVNQQSLGKIDKATKATQTSQTEQTQVIKNQLASDAARGVPLQQIFQVYGTYLNPNDIYNLYNANSSWGPAKESLSQLAIYGVKDINKDPFGVNPSPVAQ